MYSARLHGLSEMASKLGREYCYFLQGVLLELDPDTIVKRYSTFKQSTFMSAVLSKLSTLQVMEEPGQQCFVVFALIVTELASD